jgi:uncharacterized membrane protein
MAELVRISTHMLEAAGWAVIMIAVAASTIAYVRRVRVSGFEASYRGYRADLGRGILLGLELLIAADILKTVVIDPTLIGLAVLGGIVFIRTFLSFSLDVEINGHWPWQRSLYAQVRTIDAAAEQSAPGPGGV